MARLSLKNVWKKYGKIEAVIDLNLEVEDKEFLCLLGPSGCGKSSTLRMIAGLEEITSGEMHIDDRLVNDVLPKDRDIAMAFENYALYPHMTVYGNIAFPLDIRGINKIEIRKKVGEVAELLGIEDILDVPVKDLSGGAQQRVGVSRALVRKPKILLLDEPISHLEADLRAKMREELKRLQRSIGVTTIYVTHDQIEAMVMADRIAVMNLGRLLQLAPPDEIFNHPWSEFVGGFIGEPPMNFLECELTISNGNATLKGNAFEIDLPEHICGTLRQKGASKCVKLGIRPPHLTISNIDPGEKALVGEVYFCEPRNEDQIITVKLGENFVLVETQIDCKVEIGDKVWMTFDMNRLNIFDRETALNLI